MEGRRWTRTSICRNFPQRRDLLQRNALLSKRGSRSPTSFLLLRIHKGFGGWRQGNARLTDTVDVFREKGLDPRSMGFYRTEGSEEIVKRWEETKRDMTRDWKKRHMEAVKRRRGHGGDADDD